MEHMKRNGHSVSRSREALDKIGGASEALCAVLDRAEKMHAKIMKTLRLYRRFDRTSLRMDLASVPELDLEGLLAADDFNFSHDVFGIMRHMDRSEYPGQLMDCFVPRFARAQLVDNGQENGGGL